MSGMVPLQRGGLAEDALVRESLHETLRVEVLIPELGEVLVLLM